MANDTVECGNCGHVNPSWAQVCRSCGAPMRAVAMASTSPADVVPQGSLLAIGAALGTIVAAVLLGLLLGGLLPPAPPVAVTTPSQSAGTPTERPTPSPGFPDPSASLAPDLPGTLTFGLGLNIETQRVTNPTDTFTPGTTFAHSIELNAPFGVTQIAESVARLNEDQTETIVITAEENPLTVDPEATVDGFTVPTNSLLEALGPGTYIMRVYRGSELLAQGTFILAES